MTVRATALALLFASTAAFGQVSTDKIAAVKADEQRELKKIAKKYEGKRLSAAEARQRGAEEDAAMKAVAKKHGVNDKEYARASAKLSRADQAKVKAKVAELTKDDGKAKAGGGAPAAAKGGDGSDEPTIQVGGGDEGEEGGDEEGGTVIEMPTDDDES